MKSSILAFGPLNLCFNPFGELSTEQWLEASIVNVDHLIQPLKLKNTAVQFLADHGRGKTTHLQKLHQIFSDHQYIKLLENASYPKLPKTDLIFIDSIENLKKKHRKKIYKKTDSIAFTTHCDLSEELQKHGYKVITERISCECDQKLLKILNTRIELARESEGAVPLLNIDTVTKLRTLFGDNIRAMQHYLYDQFQNLKEGKNVQI